MRVVVGHTVEDAGGGRFRECGNGEFGCWEFGSGGCCGF